MRQGILREAGGEFRVEILSDFVDLDGHRRVMVQCIETFRPSPIFGDLDYGKQFELVCNRGCEAYIDWDLEMI